MQVLKEEIRENIRHAALLEFRRFGYENTKMRNIAEKAGMTVGNLYKYYKNKEDLFVLIVEPAYTQIIGLIKRWENPKKLSEDDKKAMLSILIETIVQIYVDYRNELLILIDGSKGSKFQDSKVTILNMVIGIVRKSNFEDTLGDDLDKTTLARAVSVGFMEGFIEILRNCTDKIRIKMLVRRYFEISGPGILK